MENDDKGANATTMTAAFLAALNISDDEGIPDVRSRNEMCRCNGESESVNFINDSGRSIFKRNGLTDDVIPGDHGSSARQARLFGVH